MFVIRLIRRTDSTKTDYDGKYLIDFDPGLLNEKDEEDPFVHLVVTDAPKDARKFENEIDAWNFYLDKPLSAFAVDLLEVEAETPKAEEPETKEPEAEAPETKEPEVKEPEAIAPEAEHV
jgi:hypothetical protein